MVYELLEAGENNLAREVVRSSAPLQTLRERDVDRYTYLERLCREPDFDETLVYGKSTKEKRRQQLVDLIRNEVRQVEPSRLLSLLQQAVVYQQDHGIVPKNGKFDLFFGSRHSGRTRSSEAISRVLSKYVRSSEEEKITIIDATVSTATNVMVGKTTGKLEIWSKETYELRSDLAYQANREFLLDTSAITACCFSKDGDYSAVGNAAGEVKIWRISTGKCMRTFPLAHTSSVTSLQFSKDGTQLLSTSSDNTARLHGLKSGKTLKEFRYTIHTCCLSYLEFYVFILYYSFVGAIRHMLMQQFTWANKLSLPPAMVILNFGIPLQENVYPPFDQVRAPETR